LAAGLILFFVATAAASDPAPAWEVELFEAVNGLPRGLDWVLWPFTQVGNVLAFAVAGVVLWFLVRHWRPPVTLVIFGAALGWLGAKAVKEIVGRGRPDALVGGVEFAFGSSIAGLGFPSGHVVVAFTIAVVFSPYVTRGVRWALYGVAAVVALARVHTGAHMPLDVIGGIGFGLAVGSLICLVAGVLAAKARTDMLG
jgi:undecaprenyl-diphosphatase